MTNLTLKKGKKNPKISEARKRRKKELGYINSPEARKKMSESQKGHPPNSGSFKKGHKLGIGRKLSDESKRKIGDGNRGKTISEECRKRISETLKGKIVSDETKKRISKALKEKWKNKEYRENQIKVTSKGLQSRPTSFEQNIIDLCKKNKFPFKYVGDGEVIIASKNPDFIENNGKKLIIETYSFYWHPEDYEEKRYNTFKEYGYRTLFLNDDDLTTEKWEEICSEKIKRFIGGYRPT